MKEMLTRIGSKKPHRFGVSDLTQGFYQMPLHENSRAPTVFICFRRVYEWTRVYGIVAFCQLFPEEHEFQRIPRATIPNM